MHESFCTIYSKTIIMEVYTENCLMKEAFVTVVKNKVNIILHENAHKLFATMPFHDYLLL